MILYNKCFVIFSFTNRWTKKNEMGRTYIYPISKNDVCNLQAEKKYFLKDIFMRKKQYLSLPLEDDMGCSSSRCFRFLIQSSRELCVPKDNWDNASNNTATEIVTKAFGNIVLLYFGFSGRYVFLSVWTKIIQW